MGYVYRFLRSRAPHEHPGQHLRFLDKELLFHFVGQQGEPMHGRRSTVAGRTIAAGRGSFVGIETLRRGRSSSGATHRCDGISYGTGVPTRSGRRRCLCTFAGMRWWPWVGRISVRRWCDELWVLRFRLSCYEMDVIDERKTLNENPKLRNKLNLYRINKLQYVKKKKNNTCPTYCESCYSPMY